MSANVSILKLTQLYHSQSHWLNDPKQMTIDCAMQRKIANVAFAIDNVTRHQHKLPGKNQGVDLRYCTPQLIWTHI